MSGARRPRDGSVSITASRLRDGAVVWWREDGAWSLHFDQAATLPAEAAATALAEAQLDEARCIVIGTYLAPVSDAGDGPEPASWKERIRARGPTTQYGGGGLHGQS